MALDKTSLKSGILTILQNSGGGKSAEQAQEDFADQMSTLIDTFVRSGAVNSGIIVQVNTGTGTGATTGPGTIS